MKIRFGIIVLFLFFSSPGINAQITSSRIKITGLTCSACSFGTEKSIRQLKFVDDVKMDLNTHSAEIIFKKGEPVSIDKLVQKVYDAGFSVAGVSVTWHFTDEKALNKTWVFEGNTYCILNDTLPVLAGNKEITFVAPKYMSKKEYLPYKEKIKQFESQPGLSGKKEPYFVLF
ncbi:MAG TPA: heavy metal-associated domain-containing protein [Bacteroidia bacterium]|jgi:cation transport ATPase|nr:heavy metal-associated domain-containing protein [Bacteroidia bacterium]